MSFFPEQINRLEALPEMILFYQINSFRFLQKLIKSMWEIEAATIRSKSFHFINFTLLFFA